MERRQPLFRKIRWATIAVLLVTMFGVSVSAIRLHSTDVSSNDPTPLLHSTPLAEDSNITELIPEDLNGRDPDAPEVLHIAMPDNIGQISMPKKRTIWWTIHNIYGETDQVIMKKVYAMNPHIQDRNVIYEGTIITLPAIPAEAKPVDHDDVIVALDSGQDLESMYNIFRNNPDEQMLPPLMFFSFWDKKKGFEFALIIDQKFKNKESAEEFINKLPPIFAARTKILSRWDEDTVFFNRRALQY
jgi:phage tail protein X